MRFSPAKKLVLALVHATRKLQIYFQSHPVCVLTDQPIKAILSKSEHSGRLAKWAIELGEFDITLCPRTPIKAQALADFMAELTPPVKENLEEESAKDWVLYVDGSSNLEGSGTGLLLISPEGIECSYALHFEFSTSNNMAEYEALLTGMELARKIGAQHLEVFIDSQLVVKQVLKEYEAKDERMLRYLGVVHEAASQFKTFKIQKIPRSQNKRADALAQLASTSYPHGEGTA